MIVYVEVRVSGEGSTAARVATYLKSIEGLE